MKTCDNCNRSYFKPGHTCAPGDYLVIPAPKRKKDGQPIRLGPQINQYTKMPGVSLNEARNYALADAIQRGEITEVTGVAQSGRVYPRYIITARV